MIELRRRYSRGVQSPSFSRLPAGYQEVEWLMNKDGAYIETGVVPPDGCCFEVEAALKTAPLLQVPEYDYVVFGCDINYDKKGFSLSFNNKFESPALGIIFHMNESVLTKGGTGVFPTTDVFYKYKYENGTCIINNEVVLSDNPFISFGYAVDIFALRRGYGHVGRQDGLKLKPLKLYTDNADIAEFIPCYRISDRVAGMYDSVNDVFYTNAGSGEFLCGPDVHYNIPPEYQQVEYLDNSNNPYAYLIMEQIQKGFVGNIQAVVCLSQGTQQVAATPYRFAFGWYNGPQAVIKTDVFPMLWHNTTTSSIPAEIGVKYAIETKIMETASNEYISDLYVDNKLASRSTKFNNENPLYILNSDGKTNSFMGKLYLFASKGTVNTYLIPCYRRADDVAGMYDLVSGEFYTNKGTGKFEVGLLVI